CAIWPLRGDPTAEPSVPGTKSFRRGRCWRWALCIKLWMVACADSAVSPQETQLLLVIARYDDRSAGVTDPWGNQWYMAHRYNCLLIRAATDCKTRRSEERRVGKECRYRWASYQ